jgi:acid phosphatase type 7
MAKAKAQKAKKTAGQHVFGRTRPSQLPKMTLHTKPKRDTHFRDLPDPSNTSIFDTPRESPFQLDLASVISPGAIQAITKAKKLTFHLNGDLGGIGQPAQQTLVASGMEADFAPDADASANPAFLYVAGDCVYFNGEKTQYYPQFYQPYEFYNAPIFAVPGNHDGENLPGNTTLDGFIYNLCASSAIKRPESGDTPRTAMIQPYVYWTLLTPMVNIVGLYSNVPNGGEIRAPQTDWLVDQFETLSKKVPLLVALHHPLYSADDFHSGSTYMKTVIEKASHAAGRSPDMVLAGHVHNYQRITHIQQDGTLTPHIVTGAGGYPNLHNIIKINGEKMVPPAVFDVGGGDHATVEKYSDDHHGFMRLEVTPTLITGRYYEVPRPQDPYTKGSQLRDYFEYDWKNRRYVPNQP